MLIILEKINLSNSCKEIHTKYFSYLFNEVKIFLMNKFITTAFFLLFFSLTTQAQDRSWNASVGAGVLIKKNMRAGNTYEDMDKNILFKPIPMIQASWDRFSIGAQGISIRALGNPMMNISAFIKRDGDRYHGLGMIPRKDSVFVGSTAKFFNYGFSFSKDINGRSKGSIATANYSKFFPVTGSFLLRSSLSLDWLDDKYAEYYYGVRYNEVTIKRAEYHLNNYFLPGLSVMPIYKLTERSTITTILSIKLPAKAVRHSPTMKGSWIDAAGILAYSYNL